MFRWSSSGFAPEERFDAWRVALNATHLPWRMRQPPRRSFAAELRSLSAGAVTVVDCRCDPCAGFRDAPALRGGDDGVFGVLTIRKGREIVRQGDRVFDLRPGSLLIWEAKSPIEFEVLEPLEKSTLFVPREALAGAAASRSLPIGPLDARRGFGALLFARLSALSAVIEDFDRMGGEELGLSLMQDLLNAAEISGAKAILSPREGLLRRIDRLIEANFEDPDFGPEDLARFLGVSARSLQKALQEEGDAAVRRIRRRRLEAVRADLENPVCAGLQIAQIGFARGFSDLSHLSRAFRARYGASPLEWRRSRRAPQDAPRAPRPFTPSDA